MVIREKEVPLHEIPILEKLFTAYYKVAVLKRSLLL